MPDLPGILSALLDLPEMAELPTWANPETLATLAAAAIVVLLVAAYLAFRVVKAMVFKALILGLAVLLSLSLWDQRAQLQSCADDCQCTLFGQVVQIPVDKNPRCA